jgi:hypothetical protein
MHDIRSTALTVRVDFTGFEEWWEPFTLGVGPAGSYVAGLTESKKERLRLACEASLPPGPFPISATAWAARGVA